MSLAHISPMSTPWPSPNILACCFLYPEPNFMHASPSLLIQELGFIAEKVVEEMCPSNVWSSHQKTYGPRSRTWFDYLLCFRLLSVWFSCWNTHLFFFLFDSVLRTSQVCLWKPMLYNQEVQSDALQAVLPYQHGIKMLHLLLLFFPA